MPVSCPRIHKTCHKSYSLHRQYSPSTPISALVLLTNHDGCRPSVPSPHNMPCAPAIACAYACACGLLHVPLPSTTCATSPGLILSLHSSPTSHWLTLLQNPCSAYHKPLTP